MIAVRSPLKDEYQTRQSLLFRIKERYDENAWEDFVENYKNYIYKIIISFRVEKHDADDLMQTVLLKLWKNLPEFEYDPGKGKFRYWLGRVTKNFVFKFLNKKKRLGSEDVFGYRWFNLRYIMRRYNFIKIALSFLMAYIITKYLM